jgi:hypothetical protein
MLSFSRSNRIILFGSWNARTFASLRVGIAAFAILLSKFTSLPSVLGLVLCSRFGNGFSNSTLSVSIQSKRLKGVRPIAYEFGYV